MFKNLLFLRSYYLLSYIYWAFQTSFGDFKYTLLKRTGGYIVLPLCACLSIGSKYSSHMLEM